MPTPVKQIFIPASGNITICQAVVDVDGVPTYDSSGLASTSASSGWEVEFVGLNPNVTSEGKAIFKKKNHSGGVSSYEVTSNELGASNASQLVLCTVNGGTVEKIYDLYEAYRNL